MPYAGEVLLVVGSYALGCLLTGYYLVRVLTGADVRILGSRNPGTRNVGRVVGRTWMVITFLGDAGKGAIVAVVASHLKLETWATFLAVLAVVAGHIWPVQLGFRGGKGVATSLGALAVFDWRIVAVLIVVTALAFGVTKQFTASGLIAVLLAPAVSLIQGRFLVLLWVTLLAALVLVAHRADIREIGRRAKERWRTPGIHSPD